jgi:excisionase family DNA binding protein
MKMEREVLTLAEAAKLLRVTPAALRRELERGTLPGQRINGDWRFRKAALLDWLGEKESAENPLLKHFGVWADNPLAAEGVADILAARERDRQEAIAQADREDRAAARRAKKGKQRKAA